MDANFWAIISVGVVLLGTILAGQRSLRNEISALRKRLDDVHGQLHDGLAAGRKDLADGLTSVRQELNDGLASGRKELADGVVSVRQELNEGLASVRQELNDGLASVRQELNDGLASVRQELADARERLAAIEGVLGMRQAINPKDKDQPRQPRRPAAEDRPDRRPQP